MGLEEFSLLDAAVAEVLATLFAWTCDPASYEREDLPPLAAEVTLTGTLNGASTLFVDRDSATALTENMLQMSAPELTEELVLDAVGELCNMITGSWKARQPAGEAACKLSPPALQPGSKRGFRETLLREYRSESLTLVMKLAWDKSYLTTD